MRTQRSKAGEQLLIRQRPTARGVAFAALAVLAVSACGDDDDADDSGSQPVEAPAVATFEVAGSEQYKIELVTDDLVDHARRLLAGEEIAAIPLGRVVRNDPSVNTPWSWHVDPSSLTFADVTIEVCDGLPSHVEGGLITSADFCPWSAEVIALEPKP
jgi:hypothetical protein